MIRIRQLKLSIEKKDSDLLPKIAKKLNISLKKIKEYKIVKKSLDARDKKNLMYVYEVDVELLDNENEILAKNTSKDIYKQEDYKYQFIVTGTKRLTKRPIIVGSGPAGLFCAYILAENGYKPLIIERGAKVEQRVEDVEEFWKNNRLNKNSNVQFGEGGAGTFSDGKLNTLVKDKKHIGKKVFEIFVENGAPKEILYLNKPHIGTDILRKVIVNMRKKIISIGGEYRFNCCLTNLNIENNVLKSIEINHNEKIACDILVLAIGHSARDTYNMLYENNLSMQAKPFALGLRIEHPQDMINISQYGKNYKNLPPASYKLTYTTKAKRGVYSFCMCPGGYVLNSSSEENGLSINGMSNYKRDTKNANSAIVVTVSPNDFGTHPLDGIKFQRKLEQAAYKLGNGKIPIQLYKNFKDNKESVSLGGVVPITKGDYCFADLNKILPNYISGSIKEAMLVFGKKIKGFDREDAILLGVESRTSSPVRITRDSLGVSNILGIYPSGEGSGYAGGITTAAIDGVKTAENIAKKYRV